MKKIISNKYIMIRSDGKRSVAIYSGSWNIKENLEVIRSINQCGAKQLRLFGNRRMELVKDIQHIHFEKLILLDLWDNQINSIEALPLIHIPNLESLQLQKNRIFSIRILRKANWSSLEFLNISENYICDHETLSYGLFSNLSQLTLYGRRKKKNRKDKFMSICFPAKLQTNCLNRFWITFQNFTVQEYLTSIFKQKWDDLELL